MQRLAIPNKIRQRSVAVLQDPDQVEIVVGKVWQGSLMQSFWVSVHADVLFLPSSFLLLIQPSPSFLASLGVVIAGRGVQSGRSSQASPI